MNSIQLENTLKNILTLYQYMREGGDNGIARFKQDTEVLNFLIRLFHITELDSEEIIPLWVDYLNRGVLNVDVALRVARKRVALSKA